MLRRLEAYLAVHAPTPTGVPPIEVVYVFGGDNAGFARAFIGRGSCVCVPRQAGNAHRPLHDSVDLRDLLVGARLAGLVTELPDCTVGRLPYVLLYVSPSARLSLPGTAAAAFSIGVWQANVAFFRRSAE